MIKKTIKFIVGGLFILIFGITIGIGGCVSAMNQVTTDVGANTQPGEITNTIKTAENAAENRQPNAVDNLIDEANVNGEHIVGEATKKTWDIIGEIWGYAGNELTEASNSYDFNILAGNKEAIENAMSCPKCGEMIAPDANFCISCGEKLK